MSIQRQIEDKNVESDINTHLDTIHRALEQLASQPEINTAINAITKELVDAGLSDKHTISYETRAEGSAMPFLEVVELISIDAEWSEGGYGSSGRLHAKQYVDFLEGKTSAWNQERNYLNTLPWGNGIDR